MDLGQKQNDPFAWRKPQPMEPLASFDYPEARKRSVFDAEDVASISQHRMCGWAYQLSPEQIRDAIQKSDPSEEELGYLQEMIIQMDAVDFRIFVHRSGVSVYEIANIMSKFVITSPFLMHYINRFSNTYDESKTILPKYKIGGNMYHPFIDK